MKKVCKEKTEAAKCGFFTRILTALLNGKRENIEKT